MSSLLRLGLFIVLLNALGTSALAADLAFERDIQPIFAAKCYECHGPDKAKGGLRLTTREQALKPLASEKIAIVPGDAARSELIARVLSKDPDERMPPKGDGLTAAQIETLKRWIAAGAEWRQHWAYRLLEDVSPPPVKNAAWARNPIDHFIGARLESERIDPSPEADRYTQIKRLHYDLLGLPPVPADVDAFVTDKAPDAYEKLADRLLQSPHFGERWGRHWLDKARYADSDGYEKDNARPDAWRYRDWVVEAINADMPFDRFTVEQIAGDLLPNATQSQILATAFNRQTLTNSEGGVDKEQFRVEAVFDRVETLGSVWLGLTVGCARCHTHKYDQITQREYYQLFAFFNNGDEVNLELPQSREAMEKYQQQKRQHEEKLRTLQEQLEAAKKPLQAKVPEWERQIQQMLKEDEADAMKFHALDVLKADATGEITLKRLDDGSFLATGEPLDDGAYTLTARTVAEKITGFRLEALADASLPKGGPGRADNGNFVLSEFRVETMNPDSEQREAIPLREAAADFNQDQWNVAGALDGDAKTGWGISPQVKKDHYATFRTRDSFTPAAGSKLIFKLEQHHGMRHLIGRLRIMAMTGTRAPTVLPEAVRTILAADPARRDDAQREQLLNHYASVDPTTAGLVKQIIELRNQMPKTPTLNVRVIGQRKQDPRTTKIFHRGEFLQPGEEVQPGILSVLHPLESRQKDRAPDRLDLANWLVHPANPVTPRVAVNHIWANLFGRGLAPTMNDFGVRGERPTHPELFDWLALEYRRRGWSLKAMIKLIVTSAAYRQSSRHRPELVERDPQNILLHRQNRFRAEGEIVRDLSLAVSSLLAPRIGGPSVFPPLPEGVAALSYAGNFKWNTSSGEDRYRRGMYTFFKRTAPHPNLMTFDCPDSNTTAVERRQSNTPLQALTMLNNECFAEAAQALGKRLVELNAADRERVTYAFRLCVVRPPTDAETTHILQLLNFSRKWYAKNPAEAAKLPGRHLTKNAALVDAAAWVATARILMNLDEFICRE